MNFDLELFLVIGVVLTGVVWLIDALALAPRRRKAAALNAKAAQEPSVNEIREPWYVEYAKSFFPVLFVVLVLRSFVIEPFRIPSGSMKPTLLVGDFILVNKFAYGLRLPVINTRIFATGEPQRGDIMVFRFPENPKQDYIKRVVGLPGDRIDYYGKVLYINGKAMPQEFIGLYEDPEKNGGSAGAKLMKENLMGVEHDILIMAQRMSIEKEYVVPPGHYFAMGDNRDNSNDSRFWGPVPEENLVGKAFFIWMNWNFQDGTRDFSRVGSGIK